MLPNRGAVLGIDVGYSEHRPTTCLCLLEWADDLVQLSFKKVGTDPTSRTNALCGLLPNPKRLAAVAIDGPLTRGLRLVTHYRIADALFSRGVFQKRGKPGQTSSPVGQRLHDHATRLAELVVECAARDVFSIAPAVHIEPIHKTALVESFPNQFLGSLIDESNLPVLNRDASDWYWEYLATSGGLEILLRTLLEPCRFEMQPGAIKDHDERAAVTCALTALAVAAESAVGVGDPEDGDIFLPPTLRWGASCSESSPWIESALRKNVEALRADPRFAKTAIGLAARAFTTRTGSDERRWPTGRPLTVHTQVAYTYRSGVRRGAALYATARGLSGRRVLRRPSAVSCA